VSSAKKQKNPPLAFLCLLRYICIIESGGGDACNEKVTRQRPVALRVIVTVAERREMKIAAAKADMPLSMFVRAAALEKAKAA
jgi:hypothetical protein